MWFILRKIFIGGGIVAAVMLLWNWLWFKPEIWNGTAQRYKSERDQAVVDLTATRIQNDSLVIQNKRLEGTIFDITARWQDAIAYGNKFKADLQEQFRLSDANAARLSRAEQEIQMYLGLQQDNTLDKNLDVKTLTPADDRVVLANLQTINRQVKSVKTLDSVGRVIGALTVQTDRMGGILKRTGPKLGTVSITLKVAARKARFLVFETKQSKRLKQAAATVDTIRADVQRESELEGVLNKKQ